MIEFLAVCVAVLFIVLFVISGIYDIRTDKQQKRIDELEKENAELHFEADRAEAVKRDFNQECG